ncbi:hypothetical protein GCM10009038_19380 [Salinicola rhizosphaerae]|uniref:Cytochrome c-type biogenesis protein n=2 Tax=Salinicola rhizosphaerae TaxID=1443141 RepID=A0ABQ3E1F9_9GAMM|nr:hypothetical protein GCM10009038_19380 [Salinicola rhizosphaerae]
MRGSASRVWSRFGVSIGLLLVSLLMSASVSAAIEVQDFQDPALASRYADLSSRLRCPKCQNESIAASNSPISADMRARVATLLREGESDKQIESAMVSRFGDYVLYDPKLETRTWLLWGLPFALVLIGGSVIAGFVIKRRRLAQRSLDDDERDRLASLVARHRAAGSEAGEDTTAAGAEAGAGKLRARPKGEN